VALQKENLMSITPPLAVGILIFILAILAVAGYFTVRPRMLRWGATPAEAGRVMPGDKLISNAILVTTRAISIDVGPQQVWPWLVQMGQGRGGFYSYDWLENLLGLEIHNSDRIIPDLQNLKPGDLIPFWRGAGVNAVVIEPQRLLVLAGSIYGPKENAVSGGEAGGTWVFMLQESETQGTRMIVRSRVAKFQPSWLSGIFMRILEPAHFIMEQKMLRGIKERAEGV
jgi:hypothetical protein